MRNIISSALLATTAIGVGLYFYFRIGNGLSPNLDEKAQSQSQSNPQEDLTLYVKIPKELESVFGKHNSQQTAQAAFIVDDKITMRESAAIDYLPGKMAVKFTEKKWLLEHATGVRVGSHIANGGVIFSTQLAPFNEALKPDSPMGLSVYVRHVGLTNKSCLPGKGNPKAVSIELRPSPEMKSALHRERKYLFLIWHFEHRPDSFSHLVNVGMREVKGLELLKDTVKVDIPLIPNYDQLLEQSHGLLAFFFVDCSHSKTGSCLEAAGNYVWANEYVLVPKGYVFPQSFCQDQTYKFVLAPSNSGFATSVEAEMNKLN